MSGEFGEQATDNTTDRGRMTDGQDAPHDPSLPQPGGKRLVDGGGVHSRKLAAAAAKRRQRARQQRQSGDGIGAERDERDAARLERQADRFRDPLQAIGGPLAAGNGGEVVRAEPSPDPFQKMVEQPADMLAAEATEHRMIVTGGVSGAALTLGLEAAESIGARDALERNLAHQMAAAHTVGMVLSGLAPTDLFGRPRHRW